jgi:cobalt-zinc-cadmium efflux system outer membrane protein
MLAYAFVAVIAAASQAVAAPLLSEIAGTQRLCMEGPAAAVARAQRLRGSAAVTAAGVLPNPSVVVEHQRTVAGTAASETVAGVSVPLGIGGRRFLLQDAAAARREQALADAHATVFEAALAFREAYVAAAVDQARVQALAEQQAALDALSTTIQGLAKGGEAAGYDLLRQQTQARLHRRLLELAKARALASRSLLEGWTATEVVLPPVDLTALAGGSRSPRAAGGTVEPPRIRSLEAEARANAIEARAARRKWVPDLDLFAGYRATTAGAETGHGFSLGLTVPLTLFDHGQGDAARAEAEEQVARATADRLRQQHKAQLKSARLRLEVLEASLADAEKASADAAAIVDKARQLYASGEATITELLETFRVAEEARLAQIELAEEIAVARLSLMGAAGTMFDGTLDKACGAKEGER